MNRTPIKRDPEKVAEWQQRSRKPIPPVSPRRKQAIAAGAVRAAARRKRAPRAESFPPAVAALIDARDPWCVKCGSPRDLQRHHRRIRGIGGDGRDHTNCPCNSVRLCLEHHAWVHSGEGRREAETEGLIIPRSETKPWCRSLVVHSAVDSGGTFWPTCDGRYEPEPPQEAAA